MIRDYTPVLKELFKMPENISEKKISDVCFHCLAWLPVPSGRDL